MSWFKEWLTPNESRSRRVRRVVVRKKTKFQNALVADTYSFGRCLVLDGEMQSSELDEFIYHEALVHPAMLCHPNPTSVLILGGGEGATARETLKHRSVREIVMVDIDGEVVDFCRRHLTSWHRGSFSSPKLNVIIDDARAYIENGGRGFDVIIADLPTPADGSPVNTLYTHEFFGAVRRRLNAGGVFVTQAGSADLTQFEVHGVIHATLRGAFMTARPFYAHVPSFDVPWSFVVAATPDPVTMSAARIDAAIRRRVRGPLSFYDGQTHTGLFNIPKHIRALLAKEKRAMTQKKKVHFTH